MSKQSKWFPENVDIPSEWRRFVIEAVRGGDTRDDDEGDICIDDFVLTIGRCRSELIAPYNPPTSC